MATGVTLERHVAAVRAFNRFYTRQIGVLEDGYLHSPFSLTELRVLYELARRDPPSATDIRDTLGLDHGYLSRILRGFTERGLVTRTPAPGDRRQQLLALTTQGRRLFATIDKRQQEVVATQIDRLGTDSQRRLVAAMETITGLLAPSPPDQAPCLLRPHRAGDMGWIVARHGALYAEHHGFDASFEALCAEIVAAFLRNFDPRREGCWIAERNGEAVGSVFVVKQSDTVAKLRLLLVEPQARGLGLGTRLVQEAVRFARRAEYETMSLWTQSILVDARRLYQQAGFRLVKSEPHHSFGVDLTGEFWELRL